MKLLCRKFSSGYAINLKECWNNKHPLFKFRQIQPNVWQIVEKFYESWNLANIYYFRGQDKDLLCDSGVGIYPINKFLESVGLRNDLMKPMIVALTHTHFDHSGGVKDLAKVTSKSR